MQSPLIIRCVLNFRRYVVRKKYVTLNFITRKLEESDTFNDEDFVDCEEYQCS